MKFSVSGYFFHTMFYNGTTGVRILKCFSYSKIYTNCQICIFNLRNCDASFSSFAKFFITVMLVGKKFVKAFSIST